MPARSHATTLSGSCPRSDLDLEGLQQLLDGLIDAAVVVDAQLRPLLWNAAYVKASGLRWRAFSKRIGGSKVRCRDLVALDVCDGNCLAERCLASGRPVRMDEIRGGPTGAADGQATTLIVSATPILQGSKPPIAVLEVYRDVTAEARIQSRYKALLEQERQRADVLEDQVRVRTAELQHSLDELVKTRAQLIQSEKLSSLGQLIAGIAHEINNPINFVYGNSEFLEKYVRSYLEIIDAYDACHLDATDRERVEEMKRAVDFDYLRQDSVPLVKSMRTGAERAANIIHDLRSFIHSRPDQRGPVDLATGINETLTLLAHEMHNRIEIVREGFADAPKAYGNAGQLNQVFMNLLLNAAQAIKGKGRIVIRIAAQDGGVVVDVEDSGAGISEENLLKVFDPFFTTKPVGQGTGLGLSLSYSLIDAHGGRLSAKSEPGGGAVFTVWLPTEPPLQTRAES